MLLLWTQYYERLLLRRRPSSANDPWLDALTSRRSQFQARMVRDRELRSSLFPASFQLLSSFFPASSQLRSSTEHTPNKLLLLSSTYTSTARKYGFPNRRSSVPSLAVASPVRAESDGTRARARARATSARACRGGGVCDGPRSRRSRTQKCTYTCSCQPEISRHASSTPQGTRQPRRGYRARVSSCPAEAAPHDGILPAKLHGPGECVSLAGSSCPCALGPAAFGQAVSKAKNV
jgi:hypothetical protein